MADIVLESKKERQGIESPIIKDSNGYYRVTFGAFNTFNNNGEFYRVPDIEKVLGPGSLVHRRIDNGILRSEYNHPKVTLENLRQRTIFLDPDRICAHIKKIEIENLKRSEPGFNLPIYKIYGWVKPEGPYGKYLQEALENPDENVAFSVRSLVKRHKVGNTWIRDVLLVSTWDYVHEPGYKIATQWNAAGLESAMDNDIIITDDNVDEIIHGFEEQAAGMTCKDGVCVIESMKDLLHKHENKILKW